MNEVHRPAATSPSAVRNRGVRLRLDYMMPLPGHTTGGRCRWSTQHGAVPAVKRHHAGSGNDSRCHITCAFQGPRRFQQASRKILDAHKKHRIPRTRQPRHRSLLRRSRAIVLIRRTVAALLTAGTRRSCHFSRTPSRTAICSALPCPPWQGENKQQKKGEPAFHGESCASAQAVTPYTLLLMTQEGFETAFRIRAAGLPARRRTRCARLTGGREGKAKTGLMDMAKAECEGLGLWIPLKWTNLWDCRRSVPRRWRDCPLPSASGERS